MSKSHDCLNIFPLGFSFSYLYIYYKSSLYFTGALDVKKFPQISILCAQIAVLWLQNSIFVAKCAHQMLTCPHKMVHRRF